MESGLPLTRRALLFGASATAGLALSGAARRFGLGDSPYGLGHAACLERLYASLNDGQRALTCFGRDHPLRQVTNTAPVARRPHLGTLLRADQRELVQALAASMFSAAGLRSIAPTLAVDAGGLDACNLAIYGRPGEAGFAASISGAHLHVRTPHGPANGAAFGGAIAYGQQRGNKSFKVAGNSFAFHSDLANRVYAALPAAQRARARVADEMIEYVLQTQDGRGRFPGLPVRDMDDAARAAMKALLDGVFATYPAPAQAEAWSNLEHNGGLEALHLALFEKKAFYADGKTFAELDPVARAERPDPYFQVWRVEGPGAVIHFKGYPHVHAYVNVVRDPSRQNIGESLARLDAPLEGAALRAFMQAALARATSAQAGYSGEEVSGRLCPGEVTSGALWTLDPYDNDVVIAKIRGQAAAPELRAALAAQNIAVQPGQTYRVATSAYFANGAREFGHPDAVEAMHTSVRDLLVAEVRSHGLGVA